MKRTCRIAGPATFLLVTMIVPCAALASDNVGLRWNTAMLQAIRNTGFAPSNSKEATASKLSPFKCRRSSRVAVRPFVAVRLDTHQRRA